MESNILAKIFKKLDDSNIHRKKSLCKNFSNMACIHMVLHTMYIYGITNYLVILALRRPWYIVPCNDEYSGYMEQKQIASSSLFLNDNYYAYKYNYRLSTILCQLKQTTELPFHVHLWPTVSREVWIDFRLIMTLK